MYGVPVRCFKHAENNAHVQRKQSSHMCGVHVRRTCTPHMYHSINSPLAYNVLLLCLFITVSIARRLQDPLAELIKIDAKNIGVGMYQVGHLISSYCSLISERLRCRFRLILWLLVLLRSDYWCYYTVLHNNCIRLHFTGTLANLSWFLFQSDTDGQDFVDQSHAVELNARPSSTVPDGFLPSGFQHHITATTSICQPTTPSHSTLLAKHHRSMGFLCRCSIGVEFFAGLLAWSCYWPRYI